MVFESDDRVSKGLILSRKFKRIGTGFEVRKRITRRRLENERLLKKGSELANLFQKQHKKECRQKWVSCPYIVVITVVKRHLVGEVLNQASKFNLQVVSGGHKSGQVVRPLITNWGDEVCLYGLSFEKLIFFLNEMLKKGKLFINWIYFLNYQLGLRELIEHHLGAEEQKKQMVMLVFVLKRRMRECIELWMERLSMRETVCEISSYIRGFEGAVVEGLGRGNLK